MHQGNEKRTLSDKVKIKATDNKTLFSLLEVFFRYHLEHTWAWSQVRVWILLAFLEYQNFDKN